VNQDEVFADRVGVDRNHLAIAPLWRPTSFKRQLERSRSLVEMKPVEINLKL
jgi:hypothetical protein